ncbi:hypothetical protein HHK36_006165 [Tetracentron sinense]|uniref:BAH domain-containing protein n=1 Tax=Tetracentron sinense TaxID=13715 RepID=A0A834ZJX5_TETSI|nr:hypothetical protein HHK36_006165 [Tetracentron sinense]
MLLALKFIHVDPYLLGLDKPAMSHSEEAAKVEKYEFKWGKKRGVGGKKKDIQFYESFTYDGVEYFLYDCVYLYKEGEPEPYIGKLVKIWEQPDHKKKVKVLWFFRPVEIINWLGDDVPLDNEIFLASGEGVGVSNVDSLVITFLITPLRILPEVIDGKCNVVCTSKDSINPQPSMEEVKMADYIFYRTFDVGQFTISDKIDEKVAGVEVRFIFNKKEGQKSGDIPKLDADKKKKNGNIVATNEASQLLSKINSSGGVKASLVKHEPLLGEKLVSGAGADLNETATADFKQEHISDEKTVLRPKDDSDEDEDKAGMNQVEDNKKLKSAKDFGGPDNRPSKKARLDSSVRSSEEPQPNISSLSGLVKDGNKNIIQKKPRVDPDEGVKALGVSGSASEDRTTSKLVKDSKKVKSDELSNGTLPKGAGAHAPEKEVVSNRQELEVTRKPDAVS